MSWADKMMSGLRAVVRRGIPDNPWVKCERCHQTLFRRVVEQARGICPSCGAHFRIGHREYLNILLDDGRFRELGAEVRSTDSLDFKDLIPYSDRLKEMKRKTGIEAAVLTGLGRIDGRDVGIGIHEMGFIGGSLGSAEGERICRLVDRCMEDRLPLIVVCRSGGARMQEGARSLMQMAKVNAKLARFSRMGLPYIPILADPTTAGVAASYGMVGDVTIAEPDALIGFTGERVTGESVDPDELEKLRQVQRAEHQLKNGFVDLIVRRDEMKRRVSQILGLLCDGTPGSRPLDKRGTHGER